MLDEGSERETAIPPKVGAKFVTFGAVVCAWTRIGTGVGTLETAMEAVDWEPIFRISRVRPD
jgi:hypothetical protein